MDDVFDPFEPVPCLSKFMEDEELQRLIDSLDSDELHVPLLPPPPPTSVEDSLQLSEFVHVDPSNSGPNEFGHGIDDWAKLGPLDCSGCFLLREVVHSNGLHNLKLSIHGGVNVFYHAMIASYYDFDGVMHAMEPSYVDLSGKSYEQVKEFLIEYGLLRARDGFVVIQDLVSSFYDALYARMIFDTSSTESNGTPLLESGMCQSRPPANDRLSRTQKTGIAAQRERTASLHLSDFADYFHLPITEAAKEMKICPTVLKKVCRKFGMPRWPHRKVKSIDKKIAKLQEDLIARGGQGAVITQAEIQKLRDERAQLCHGLLSSLCS